jgi:hypothetical protein
MNKVKLVPLNLRTWLLLCNALFCIYFWVSFALVSQPDNGHFCMDQCFDPYVFFGRGVGLSMNPQVFFFMRAMVLVEMPSFATATLIENFLTGEPARRLLVGVFGDFAYSLFPGHPNLAGGVLFAGISFNGYRLLGTMLLSFVQWFLIAKILSWLARKFTGTSQPRNEG